MCDTQHLPVQLTDPKMVQMLAGCFSTSQTEPTGLSILTLKAPVGHKSPDSPSTLERVLASDAWRTLVQILLDGYLPAFPAFQRKKDSWA